MVELFAAVLELIGTVIGLISSLFVGLVDASVQKFRVDNKPDVPQDARQTSRKVAGQQTSQMKPLQQGYAVAAALLLFSLMIAFLLRWMLQ